MSSEDGARLLVVDDERPLVEALCATLQMEGYRVTGHSSAGAALESLRSERFDVLITDLMMPEMDGIAMLQAAWLVDPALAGIVMTGQGTIDTAVRAMQLGALDYMQKPFSLDIARAVIARALQMRRLRLDNTDLLAREREYTRDLERANQDLDAFAVSVSHDLRAPLRAITGFTSVLLADHRADLNEAGQRQLEMVAKSSARMDRMLDDLLNLCRCSRQPLHKTHVDTNAVVVSVLADVGARFAAHTPTVQIGKLPACEADRSLLEQVFTNLLSNAFKFTQHTPSARIDIGFEEDGSGDVYYVRDNGAGFDLKYASRLFGVFQRMHAEKEFEGTGVGLSIVRRIVERHGGRIWADSSPGQGATFYFSLVSAITKTVADPDIAHPSP